MKVPIKEHIKVSIKEQMKVHQNSKQQGEMMGLLSKKELKATRTRISQFRSLHVAYRGKRDVAASKRKKCQGKMMVLRRHIKPSASKRYNQPLFNFCLNCNAN